MKWYPLWGQVRVNKMECFKSEPCSDFNEFLSKVKDLVNEGWMFRGQKKACWLLEHKFERACKRFGVSKKDKARLETNMIREFKRRLHHYTANIPSNDADDEWLALMQHHGAPTRLLDFTYSHYVAAYFAFEFAEANTTVAIWAIDYTWFSDSLEGICKEYHKKYRDYSDHRERYGKYFNDVFINDPKKFIVAANPFRLNERLAYQRGVFLCPGDVSVSLMDNLSVYKDKAELIKHIVQYTIPAGGRNQNAIKTLEVLDSMNINRITLFPGLDGFAQSFEPRINSLFLRQYGH